MIDFNEYQVIADKIFADLGISEDAYKTWSDKDEKTYFNQYLKDTDYIMALVDIELSNYDTSDMVPAEIEDLRYAIRDAVWDKLSDIHNNYDEMQEAILYNAYDSIRSVLYESHFENVVNVEEEYDPADPSVGIFNDERRIEFTLSNGAVITFVVELYG